MNETTTATNFADRRLVNEEVTVTSMYFQSKPNDRSLKGYPKRMEYEGREYTFIETGLRYLLHKGAQLFEVFDMTDGQRAFRLKFDPEQHSWTLVGVLEGRQAIA